LGLALAERIVHAHGGTIELTSQVGKGTTARILLPCVAS
jgi:signal transduction histidine kinase